MVVADQAVEIARKEKAQRETQPVVVSPPRPVAAAAATPDYVTGDEAENAAKDEHELLEGLFTVSKSSSGASIGEPPTAAGTGAQEGEDRQRSLAKSQVKGPILTS